MRKFIERVQNSNEVTKRFWVAAFSGVSMLLVLGLWLGYLNVALAPIPGPKSQPIANSVQPIVANGAQKLEKPGFFSVFAAGVKIIFDEAKERFLTKRDIIIKSSVAEKNFVAENLEPVKGAELPK